jgi:hypothetical protein
MKRQINALCITFAAATAIFFVGGLEVQAQTRVINPAQAQVNAINAAARANNNLYRSFSRPAAQPLPVRGPNASVGLNNSLNNNFLPSNNFNPGYNNYSNYQYGPYSNPYSNGYNNYNQGYYPYNANPFGTVPYGYYPGY